jgi:glutathione peroxidase
LAFPCNQFGSQEPGTNAEVLEFAQRNYAVTFPMHAKIDVNGKNAHPLYRYLKREATGILGTEAIKWNFTKFIVDRDGKVIDREAPKTTPSSLVPRLEALLAASPSA